MGTQDVTTVWETISGTDGIIVGIFVALSLCFRYSLARWHIGFKENRNVQETTPSLTEYYPVFVECFLNGLKDWKNEVSARARTWTGKLTMASFIRDSILQRLRERASVNKGIRFESRRGLAMIVIEDEALVRINKLNRELRVSSIPTNNQKEYFSPSLFGFQALLTRVVVGYRLSKDEASILKVIVSFYAGKEVEESVEIYHADGTASADDREGLGGLPGGSPRQPVPTEDAPASGKRRVRPKDGRDVEAMNSNE